MDLSDLEQQEEAADAALQQSHTSLAAGINRKEYLKAQLSSHKIEAIRQLVEEAVLA